MHSAPMPSSSRQAGTASSDRCCWAGSPVGVEEAGVGHSWMTQWSPSRGGTDPTRLRRRTPHGRAPPYLSLRRSQGHPAIRQIMRQEGNRAYVSCCPGPPGCAGGDAGCQVRGAASQHGQVVSRLGQLFRELAANTQTTERADNNSAPDPACPQPAVRVVRIAFIKINAAGTNYRL